MVLRLPHKKPEDIADELNEYGRDGWRLVSVYDGHIYLIRSERSRSSSGDPNSCEIEK
jgi:hypothetical protein